MKPPSADYECGPQTARRQLSRHLVGKGIELGPGHIPFPVVMPSTTVQYLDAWAPGDSGDRFPEIEHAEFSPPDTICDFNTEGLGPIADDSQDFAVASHVLEHLANPLRMLCELHRVVRPSGTVLIFLPDRHQTFDKDRPPTPLAHVIEEFEVGVTEVDDAHIEEFIRATATHQGGGPPGTASTPDPDLDLDRLSLYERGLALLWLRWEDVTVPAQRRELVELHRRRSIHAHVWSVDEFFPVLRYGAQELGHAWQFVDGLLPGDPGGRPDEFGLVLRRDPTPAGPEAQSARLDTAWAVWRSYRGALDAEVAGLRTDLVSARVEQEQLRARVADLEATSAELGQAMREAIGVLHRLGQGRDLAPEEIRAVQRQEGGDAFPELIQLLLRYRNHPIEEGMRRSLGKVKRAGMERLGSRGRGGRGVA